MELKIIRLINHEIIHYQRKMLASCVHSASVFKVNNNILFFIGGIKAHIWVMSICSASSLEYYSLIPLCKEHQDLKMVSSFVV